MQSAQLTHIGAYIIMKCRQELYHRMEEEIRRGNEVVRSYVDCYTTTRPTTQPEILGTGLGMYKEKVHTKVFVEENRMLSEQEKDLPGFSGLFRKAEIQKYHEKLVKENC